VTPFSFGRHIFIMVQDRRIMGADDESIGHVNENVNCLVIIIAKDENNIAVYNLT